jgi:hypothetical protein
VTRRIRSESLSGAPPSSPRRREPCRFPPGLPPHGLVHPGGSTETCGPNLPACERADEVICRALRVTGVSRGSQSLSTANRAATAIARSSSGPVEKEGWRSQLRGPGDHTEGVRGNRWFPRRGAGAEPLQRAPSQTRAIGRALPTKRVCYELPTSDQHDRYDSVTANRDLDNGRRMTPAYNPVGREPVSYGY